MKKLYFLITIFLFAKTISAQQYVPLLDSANEWSYSNVEIAIRLDPHIQSGPCSYPVYNGYPSYKEYTANDTVINSNTYKVVINNLFSCTMGYIREDTATRKIYFIDNTSSTEKLLYDFSMQVGDTMTFNFTQSGMYVSGLYTLDSITNVQVQVGLRKQFWFNCHSNPGSLTFSWVEGVGNFSYLLYPYFVNNTMTTTFASCPGIQHHFDQFLICFDHNYKVYYDSCSYSQAMNNPCCAVAFDTCDYFSFIGAIPELPSLSSMTIFPNPSSGKTTLSLDVKQADEFEIVVWNISGKQIMKEISLGKIPEGKKDIELDLSSFSDGFYLVELKTAKGSVYQKLLIQR